MGRRVQTVKRVTSHEIFFCLPAILLFQYVKTKMTATQMSSLMCDEVLDPSILNQTPEHKPDLDNWIPWESPLTVKAIQDTTQIKDVRILQNLLRNEDRFMPDTPDYMNTFQPMVTPAMRKIVADWMLEIIHAQNSQPEVFCLAMNVMDRFLCQIKIHSSQMQLLGAVCILIASKIREPCPVPGKNLIEYTDYSITAEEIKEWELLVLYKMQWELSAITPLDYLDHALPRLGLENLVDMEELRRRTETILVLTSTDYQFTYKMPSLMAASAIMTALQSLSTNPGAIVKEILPRIQAATHTSSEQMDKCVININAMLPEYLKGLSTNPTMVVPADTTTPDFSPDLICTEELSHENSNSSEDSNTGTYLDDSEYSSLLEPPTPSSIRSNSPLSAVDIFTEFNTNVLQPIFDQVEHNNSGVDSFNTILVS